jgi:hypothetical protein
VSLVYNLRFAGQYYDTDVPPIHSKEQWPQLQNLHATYGFKDFRA